MCEKRSENEIIIGLFKEDVLPCPLPPVKFFSRKAERPGEAFQYFSTGTFCGWEGTSWFQKAVSRHLEYCSNMETTLSCWVGQN